MASRSFDHHRFRLELLRQGCSIRAFAERVDLSRGYLYLIGRGYAPSREALEKILGALGDEAARRVMGVPGDRLGRAADDR